MNGHHKAIVSRIHRQKVEPRARFFLLSDVRRRLYSCRPRFVQPQAQPENAYSESRDGHGYKRRDRVNRQKEAELERASSVLLTMLSNPGPTRGTDDSR